MLRISVPLAKAKLSQKYRYCSHISLSTTSKETYSYFPFKKSKQKLSTPLLPSVAMLLLCPPLQWHGRCLST